MAVKTRAFTVMTDELTQEIPLVFDCQGKQLLGILHSCNPIGNCGVLIVVGGHQYRVGGSRQFVLLARELAAKNLPTFRFDVRGMGDSAGKTRDFQHLDTDIRAAIDCFFACSPGLKHVVLWGLCDGASAALFYAYQDSRVKGLVLLNPWMHTEQGAAQTYLKHYYLQRLLSRDFWKKIFSFNFNFAESISSFLMMLKQAVSRTAIDHHPADTHSKIAENLPLPIRMRECLKQFNHPVLFILSGRDLTASQFKNEVKADTIWQGLINEGRTTTCELAEADHTFSKSTWRKQVEKWTVDWIIGNYSDSK